MNWSKIIAWSHLLGGGFGLGLIFWPNPLLVPPPGWYIGSFLFFAVSLAGGYLTIRNHRWGPRLSLGVELLQLVQVNTGAFAYIYFSGLQILLVIKSSVVTFSFAARSAFWLGPTPAPQPWFVAFDLLTLVTVPILWRQIRSTARGQPPSSGAPEQDPAKAAA
jgi:hypothetical protein